MRRLFQEAFNRGFSAGLVKQLKQEIKMSLISNEPDVKECANELVDLMENEGNGVVDFIKLISNGIIDSPGDCFMELRDYYAELSQPYEIGAFQTACVMIFDCARVVADALPVS